MQEGSSLAKLQRIILWWLVGTMLERPKVLPRSCICLSCDRVKHDRLAWLWFWNAAHLNLSSGLLYIPWQMPIRSQLDMPCGASTAHLLVPCPHHRLLQSRSLSCCACAPVICRGTVRVGSPESSANSLAMLSFCVLHSSQGEHDESASPCFYSIDAKSFLAGYPKDWMQQPWNSSLARSELLTWRCTVWRSCSVLFELLVELAEGSREDKKDVPPSSWHPKAGTAKTANPLVNSFAHKEWLSLKTTETYLRSVPDSKITDALSLKWPKDHAIHTAYAP